MSNGTTATTVHVAMQLNTQQPGTSPQCGGGDDDYDPRAKTKPRRVLGAVIYGSWRHPGNESVKGCPRCMLKQASPHHIAKCSRHRSCAFSQQAKSSVSGGSYTQAL